MKKGKNGYFKRGVAVMMLACLLFTMGRVNSRTDHNYGIMPCGGVAEKETEEL